MIRKIVCYLLLLCITGLLGILYNEYHMGILFLTLAVVPLLLLGGLYFLQKKIKTSMYLDAHVVQKGETFPIMFHFENPTIFPIPYINISFTVKNNLSNKAHKQVLEVSIDQKTTTVINCQLKSDHIGNIEISLKKIQFYDYFRLFQWTQKKHSTYKVAVLPAISELELDLHQRPSVPVESSESVTSNRKGDDPSEVFEIREYRGGDRISRVHWKLTMKQDQLMIKEFSDPIHINTLIYVDMFFQSTVSLMDEMDERMELVLSLSYTFMRQGVSHYVAWYDQQYQSCQRTLVSNEDNFYELVNLIITTGPHFTKEDGIMAYVSQYPNHSFSRLFYGSSRMDHLNWESIDIVKAHTKAIVMTQVMYDKDRDRTMNDWKNKAQEMGIDLIILEGRNKSSNIERSKKGQEGRKEQEGGNYGSKKKRRYNN